MNESKNICGSPEQLILSLERFYNQYFNSSAEEREQLEQKFSSTFQDRLELELEQSQKQLEQNQWSGSTQVSTLSTLEVNWT